MRNARKDQWRLLVESTQALSDTLQLRQPGPFRSRAQHFVRLLLGLGLQGLTEQARLSQHAFAFQAIGLLVMLVPAVQLTGCQRFTVQAGDQRLGMFGVGARQRGQHPGGRPSGKLTAEDGAQYFFRQTLHQTQAPIDPTDISTNLPGHFPLRKFESRDQFSYERTFLNRLPGAPLNAYQNDQQGLSEGAIP